MLWTMLKYLVSLEKILNLWGLYREGDRVVASLGGSYSVSFSIFYIGKCAYKVED